jgi:HSP20 family molecular chaperone IbpA
MKNYLTNGNNHLGFNLFEDIFDDFFKPTFYGVKNSAMKTDIRETENSYELAIDMPGFDKNDISLNLENGYLTVEAKKEEKEQDNKNYVRRERNFSCKRSYYVGDAVTEEDVKAKYLNGTLEILVPKKKEKEITKKNIAID